MMVANESKENRPPYPCEQLFFIPALFILLTDQGHLRKQKERLLGSSIGPERMQAQYEIGGGQ